MLPAQAAELWQTLLVGVKTRSSQNNPEESSNACRGPRSRDAAGLQRCQAYEGRRSS